MSKYIKKFITAIWAMFLVVMIAMLAAFGVTQVPAAQRFAARKVAAGLTDALGVPVSVDRLRYVPFTTVEVASLTIADRDSVPMISARRVKADASLVTLIGGELSLREIDADSISVLIRRMADSTLNLACLASDDTTSIPPFAIRQIKAKRCEVRYEKPSAKPIELENMKLDASRLRYADTGFGVSIADFSFDYPTLRSHFGLGGDLSLAGDTISVGSAHVGFGGCTANIDTAFAVIDSAGLKMARIEIPRVYANGYISSQFLGNDVPATTMALSASYESGRLNLNHLRVSVGEKTNATIKGVANVRLDTRRTTFERANLSVSGWMALADIKPFIAPEATWPDIPPLPFDGSLTATRTNASAGISINSENGQMTLYTNAASNDNWVTIDLNAEIDADLTPQGTLCGPLNRLVAHDYSRARIIRGQADGDVLRYVTFNGSVSRADVGTHSFGGITFDGQFDGVSEPNEINGQMKMSDPLGQLHLILLSQLDAVSPYVSVVAVADSVRLAEFMPGVVSADRLMGFRSLGLEFQGLDLTSALVNLSLNKLYLKSDTDFVSVDSLKAELGFDPLGRRQLTVSSDIAEAEASGDFDLAGLAYELRKQARLVMPTLFPEPAKRKGKSMKEGQHADFEMKVFGVDSLVRVFVPQLHILDTVTVIGQLDSQERMLWTSVRAKRLAYGDFSCSGLCASAIGNDGLADLTVLTDSLRLPWLGLTPNDTIYVSAEDDHVTADIRWTVSGKESDNPGFMNMDAHVVKDDDGRNVWFVGIDRSMVPVSAGALSIDSCRMSFAEDRIDVSNLYVYKDDHSLRAYGSASADPADTMWMELNNLVIEDFLHPGPDAKYSLEGNLSLCAAASSLLSSPSFSLNAGIDRFIVNGDDLEHLDLEANYEAGSDTVNVGLAIVTGGVPRATVTDGYYSIGSNYLLLPFSIDSLSTGFLNFYLDNCIDSWKGSTSGVLSLYGPASDIKLDARLKMNDDNSFRVKQTDVSYYLVDNDSVILSPKSMDFMDIRFTDAKGRKGKFYGWIHHDMFSNLDHSLKFDVNDMAILETDAKESPTYYGTIFGSGKMHITGPTTNIKIFIDATTGKPSSFTVAPNATSEVSDADFIVGETEIRREVDWSEILGTGTSAKLIVNITPDAKLSVVIDPQTGNQLSGRGEGKLEVDIERTGALLMHGTYTINEGIYNFAFSIFDKQFQIDQGSTITWDGGPYNATVDVTATYTVRASLYNLVSGTSYDSNTDLKRRVPVKCKIHLTGKMTNPNVSFGIEIPSSQNFNQIAFNQYVNTQEEISRQVFALLTSGQFYALQDADQSNSQSYLSSTLSELLSNKVSSMFSNNDRNIGIGVNYRPGDETSNEEYEVAVSTQVFDNKVVLSGNIGYGRDATSASSDNGTFIGDFDAEVKINKRGNIRAKAYTHSNNDVIYETSPTTQGIGISFQEEFDSFRDLIRSYWNKIFHRRRKAEAEPASETTAKPEDEQKTEPDTEK